MNWTPIKRYINKSITPERRTNEKKESNETVTSNKDAKGKNSTEYIGVCPNCLNGELQGCRCHKEKDNNDPNNDPFAKQALRNKNAQDTIKQKIANRYNQTQQIVKLLPGQSKKDILIQSQENKEFQLNVPTKDLSQQKEMKRYKQNQDLLKGKTFNSLNPKVDEYYKKNVSITEGSVCSIGANGYKKNIPTLSQYKTALDNQINMKEIAKIKEKENDKKIERELYEKNKFKQEREREVRKRYIEQLKSDFLRSNKMLIESKSRNNLLNKSQDLQQERQNISMINEELNNKRKEEEQRQINNRKELQRTLEEQIRQKKEGAKNKDWSNGNKPIYLEDSYIDEYGRCIKCHKQFKKEILSSIKELNKIKAYKQNL